MGRDRYIEEYYDQDRYWLGYVDSSGVEHEHQIPYTGAYERKPIICVGCLYLLDLLDWQLERKYA